MTTYCVSIHDLRLLLRQTGAIADCWMREIDSEQPGHDNHEERETTDSWLLDTDLDQLDVDDNEGTKLNEPNRRKMVSCLGIQHERRRQQRFSGLADREYGSKEEGI